MLPRCSFCGLHCELPENEAASLFPTHACELRRRAIDLLTTWRPFSPMIAGEPATWNQALDRARELLKGSRFPWITGLPFDVATSRSAIELARQYSGVVDLEGSQPSFDTIQAMHRTGTLSASIDEVCRHSDGLFLLGSDALLARFPRLCEVILEDPDRQWDTKWRTIMLVGDWSSTIAESLKRERVNIIRIQSDLAHLPSSLIRWAQPTYAPNGSQTAIFDGFERVSFLWSAEALGGLYSELWAERIFQWIERSKAQRQCVGLGLASGGVTFQQVCTWLTGYPGRIRFQHGDAIYDPNRWKSEYLIDEIDVDVVVKIDHQSLPSAYDLSSRHHQMICITSHPPSRDLPPPAVVLPVEACGHHVDAMTFLADGAVKVVCEAIMPRVPAQSASHVLDMLRFDSIEGI